MNTQNNTPPTSFIGEQLCAIAQRASHKRIAIGDFVLYSFDNHGPGGATIQFHFLGGLVRIWWACEGEIQVNAGPFVRHFPYDCR